jgi:hypothetical protein
MRRVTRICLLEPAARYRKKKIRKTEIAFFEEWENVWTSLRVVIVGQN